VFLAHRGGGVDHTSAAANIAALIEVAAARPGTRILNSADPDAPSARRIARTVARHLDHAWEEIPLDGNYAATVTEEIDWLVSAARGGADADLLPELGLDYQAEDRWLRSKRSAHDEDQGT
jgi:hypothetical protein